VKLQLTASLSSRRARPSGRFRPAGSLRNPTPPLPLRSRPCRSCSPPSLKSEISNRFALFVASQEHTETQRTKGRGFQPHHKGPEAVIPNGGPVFGDTGGICCFLTWARISTEPFEAVFASRTSADISAPPYFAACPVTSTTVTGPYFASTSCICLRSPTHTHCMCSGSTYFFAARCTAAASTAAILSGYLSQ
jgi:hypothetical protein